MSQVARCKAVQ